MLCRLVVNFLIHYLIWYFISVAIASGNNNVSVFDIENEIYISLTS
jgi:hypothetical protein